VRFFVDNGRTKLIPDFLNAFKAVPNVAYLFYGAKPGTKTRPPVYIFHGTILQLIALKFLKVDVETTDAKAEVFVKLRLNNNATFAISTDDDNWRAIHTIEKRLFLLITIIIIS
jgi:hypothetical protein